MTKRFSLPTALAVAFLGVGCSGSSPKPADAGLADAGNMNVVLDDGGCDCSLDCNRAQGFCIHQQHDDGGGYCECEV